MNQNAWLPDLNCYPRCLLPLFRTHTCAVNFVLIDLVRSFSTEIREKRRSRRLDEQVIKDPILTDTLLRIERQGEFPADDPCPYLGVRKPNRGSRYPNEYSDTTCKPHRYK